MDPYELIPHKGGGTGGGVAPTKGMVYAAQCDYLSGLSSGEYGVTYKVIYRPIKEEAVLKLGHVTVEETMHVRAAAHMGIGPDVFESGMNVTATATAKAMNLAPAMIYIPGEGMMGIKKAIPVGYIVMEALDFDLLKATKVGFSIHTPMYRAFCALFEHCYNMNFIHGDLHFQNIMWSRKNQHWKLIDFGFTKMAQKSAKYLEQLLPPFDYFDYNKLYPLQEDYLRSFLRIYKPTKITERVVICYEWYRLVNMIEHYDPSAYVASSDFVHAFNEFMKQKLRLDIPSRKIYQPGQLPSDYISKYVPKIELQKKLAIEKAAEEKRQKEIESQKKAQEAMIAAQKEAIKKAQENAERLMKQAEELRINAMKVDEGLVESVKAEVLAGQQSDDMQQDAVPRMLTRNTKKQLAAAQKKIDDAKKVAELSRALKEVTDIAFKKKQESIAARTRAKLAQDKLAPPEKKIKLVPRKTTKQIEDSKKLLKQAVLNEAEKKQQEAKEALAKAQALAKKFAEEETSRQAEADAKIAAATTLAEKEKALQEEIAMQSARTSAAASAQSAANKEASEKEDEYRKILEFLDQTKKANPLGIDFDEDPDAQTFSAVKAAQSFLGSAAVLGNKVKSIWENFAAAGSELASEAGSVYSSIVSSMSEAEEFVEENTEPATDEEANVPPPMPDKEAEDLAAKMDETMSAAERLQKRRREWLEKKLEEMNKIDQLMLAQPLLGVPQEEAHISAMSITQALANEYLQTTDMECVEIQKFLEFFARLLFDIILRAPDIKKFDPEHAFAQLFNSYPREIFAKSDLAPSPAKPPPPPAATPMPAWTPNDDDGTPPPSPNGPKSAKRPAMFPASPVKEMSVAEAIAKVPTPPPAALPAASLVYTAPNLVRLTPIMEEANASPPPLSAAESPALVPVRTQYTPELIVATPPPPLPPVVPVSPVQPELPASLAPTPQPIPRNIPPTPDFSGQVTPRLGTGSALPVSPAVVPRSPFPEVPDRPRRVTFGEPTYYSPLRPSPSEGFRDAPTPTPTRRYIPPTPDFSGQVPPRLGTGSALSVSPKIVFSSPLPEVPEVPLFIDQSLSPVYQSGDASIFKSVVPRRVTPAAPDRQVPLEEAEIAAEVVQASDPGQEQNGSGPSPDFISSPQVAAAVGLGEIEYWNAAATFEHALSLIPVQYQGPTFAYNPGVFQQILWTPMTSPAYLIPPYVQPQEPAANDAANPVVVQTTIDPQQLLSEHDKAKRKALAWWRRHPRGERMDKSRQARNVVATAAEYIPSKNDFAGVDTPQ